MIYTLISCDSSDIAFVTYLKIRRVDLGCMLYWSKIFEIGGATFAKGLDMHTLFWW